MKNPNLGLEFWVHWLVLGAIIDNVAKFKRLLTSAAKNGAVGIELPWKPLMQLSADEVAKTMLSVGIKKTALCCFWGAGGLDPLKSSDERKVMKSLEEARQFLEILEKYGIRSIGITGPWLFQIGKSYNRAPRLESRSFRIARNIGNLFGEAAMVANLETLRAEEDLFFWSTEAATEFVRELGHSDVLLHLDTFHISARGENIYDELTAADGAIGWVHASGTDRHTPGFKGESIDWGESVYEGLLTSRGGCNEICFEGFSPAFRTLVPEIGKGFPKDLPPEQAVSTAYHTLQRACICK